MLPRDLESCFALFRERRDPEALARVFDASAAKLLLVAQHLTRDASAAEDLLQGTFLAAIESAERWDRTQPLLPWLVGILANLARMRRREKRELPAPRGLGERGSEDPSCVAEARELDAALARAIEMLPALYREVLVLRLVHGLSGVQIAHALSRSPDTVRSQLHRGLEILRGSLPKGLLAPGIVALLAGDGLAAVRANVLAASGALVPAAAMTLLAGITMKKIALCVVPLVLLGSWWAVAAWPGGAPEGAESRPAQAQPARSAGGAASRAETSEEPLRTALEPEPGRRAAQRAACVIGRCIAAENRRPLAGARLRAVSNAVTEPAELVVQSAADGTFAIPVDARWDAAGFGLRITAERRVPVGATWRAWARADTVDLGDVELPLGTRVSGRLVDHAGRGIARLRISLLGLQPQPCGQAPGGAWPEAQATTTEDGTFAFADPLPRARIEVQVAQGHILEEPAALELEAGTESREVVLRVRAPDPKAVLAGIVVDERGAPLAGAVVEAYGRPTWLNAGDNRVAPAARTNVDGEFTLRCNGDASDPPELRWRVPGSATEFGPADQPYPWGTHGIELFAARARAPAGVELVVVDAETGEPVEDYGVHCAPAGKPESNDLNRQVPQGIFRMASRGRHPGGKLLLQHLGSAGQVLLVLATDPRYAPSALLRFDPADYRGSPLRVVLAPPVALAVHVRLADGTPVEGSRLEAWRQVVDPPLPWGLATPPGGDGRTVEDRWRAFLLGAARTDAHGDATLRLTRNADGLELRALGPGHEKLVRTGVTTGDGSASIELVVSRGAVLSGKVVPAEIVRALDTTPSGQPASAPTKRPGLRMIEVVPKGTTPRVLPAYGPGQIELGMDGSFRIDAIPAGTWDVLLYRHRPALRDGSGGSGPEYPALARLVITGDEQRDLVLDAARFLPARVRGRVTFDGQPLARARLQLWRTAVGGVRATTENLEPSAGDGAFEFLQAQQGTYRLAAYPDDELGRAGKRLFSDATLTLLPGESRTWDVALAARRLEVRVLDAEGAAVAGRRLFLAAADEAWGFFVELRTDRDGKAVLERAPPFELAATLRSPETTDGQWARLDPEERARRTVALGTHAVRLDAQATVVELRLPAGVR